MQSNPNTKKEELINQVRRFGGVTTDALLEPNCCFFSIPEIEGFIGYRLLAGCAVVFGDPVCEPNKAAHLSEAFHRKMKDCRNIIYLAASNHFVQLTYPLINQARIEYGKEFFLDPHSDPKEMHGSDACVLRRKVRHAEKIGLIVKEYTGDDEQIENSLEQIAQKWLKSRHGPQIHIANIHLFENRIGKRWFYAELGKEIMGLAVLNELKNSRGWLLNNLLCTKEAPGGTQELIVDEILSQLKEENCSYISFGLVLSHQLGEISGLSSFSSSLLPHVYKIARKIFHLEGYQMFWKKFFPQSNPSYLLFAHPKIGLRELFAIKKATNASIKK